MDKGTIDVAMNDLKLKLMVYKTTAVDSPLFEKIAYGIAESYHTIETLIDAAEKQSKTEDEFDLVLDYFDGLLTHFESIIDIERGRDEESMKYIQDKEITVALEFVDQMSSTSSRPGHDAAFA